jgi:hypothetical protein
MAGTGDTSIRSYNYFADSTLAGGGTYAENEHQFLNQDDGKPFRSHSFQLVNDGATDLFFRIAAPGAGPAHGRLKTGESITQDFRRLTALWLQGTGGSAFRLWAW